MENYSGSTTGRQCLTTHQLHQPGVQPEHRRVRRLDRRAERGRRGRDDVGRVVVVGDRLNVVAVAGRRAGLVALPACRRRVQPLPCPPAVGGGRAAAHHGRGHADEEGLLLVGRREREELPRRAVQVAEQLVGQPYVTLYFSAIEAQPAAREGATHSLSGPGRQAGGPAGCAGQLQLRSNLGCRSHEPAAVRATSPWPTITARPSSSIAWLHWATTAAAAAARAAES
eukprot:SAG22_NODE_2125_length_2972_cov_36.467804_2_plen_227_part_00